MFGLGHYEIMLLMLLSSGGLGSPIGYPPLPEDPVMARVAPPDCLFYTAWAGVAEADAASSNFTEQMLADPEMKKHYANLAKMMSELLKNALGNNADANVELGESVLNALRLAAANPGMAYLSELNVTKQQPPVIKGGFLLNVGAGAGNIQKLFDSLKARDERGMIKTVEIGGATFFRFQPQPDAPPLTWGVRGKFVIGGVGEGEIEQIMQRARGEAPAWLTRIRDRLKLPRVSGVTYVNPQRVVKTIEQIVTAEQGPDTAAKFIAGVKVFGFENVDAFASVAGMDGKGCVTRTWLGVNGTPSGLLSWLDSPPLVPDDLKAIPLNSPVGIAFKLNVEQTIAKWLAMAKEMDANAAQEMEQGLAGVGAQLGFDLRKDVLASLGDTWRIYANPDAGGLLTGWTIAIPVTNSQKLTPVFQQLMQIAELSLGGGQPGQPSLKKTTAGANTIYSVALPVPGVPVAPTWCLTEKELLIGASSAAIQMAMQEGNVAQSLALQPELQPYMNSKSRSFMVAYFDAKQISQILTPLMQMAMKQAGGAMGGGPIPGMPFGNLPQPPQAVVEKYLQPTVAALRRTADGVEFDMHQTSPAGNIGIAAPIITAAALPAIQKARGAAQRVSGMNNLKQIGIAMHIYHDVYQFLPPSYSIDAAGKPLLSWRVHLLPYLEAEELYKKFRLDEPWDSEHNKKLIAEMPKVYQAPSGTKVPGKTNYLGVSGPQGFFVPAKAPNRGGLTFAGITDGTSNTIAVVEANNDSAVIWTKPDDFVPNANEPTKGLLGLHPQGFSALFADASVRLIRANADPKMLNRLFLRNDGEPVDLDAVSAITKRLPPAIVATEPAKDINELRTAQVAKSKREAKLTDSLAP